MFERRCCQFFNTFSIIRVALKDIPKVSWQMLEKAIFFHLFCNRTHSMSSFQKENKKNINMYETKRNAQKFVYVSFDLDGYAHWALSLHRRQKLFTHLSYFQNWLQISWPSEMNETQFYKANTNILNAQKQTKSLFFFLIWIECVFVSQKLCQSLLNDKIISKVSRLRLLTCEHITLQSRQYMYCA